MGLHEDISPIVILLFGVSCTGKTTLGRAVAGRFSRCAFIEVDELRYKVIGGLVAFSAGQHPSTAPEEYHRQCRMGVENAVCLAQGFAKHGFSSVIEGLEDDCRPDTEWIATTFGRFRVLAVALLCKKEVLIARWRKRGWGESLPERVLNELQWYHENQFRFDCVIDTARTSLEKGAEIIYEKCVTNLL